MDTRLHDTQFRKRSEELMAAGAMFHGRNWAPATSGNYSARVSEGLIAITVSGAHKGELGPNDLMLIDADGKAVARFDEGHRPSAETGLHTMLYQRDPEVGAVLHSHSAIGAVLSRNSGEFNELAQYEMLKALPGLSTHDCSIQLPIFENDQDIERLSAQVQERMDRESLVGYLIRGHGLYAWGKHVAEARRHVEALEFILECELLERRIR